MESLQQLLSDDARRNRSHRNRISLQLNILSWFLEFITGVLMATDYMFAFSDSEFYDKMYWFIALDTFLCGVLVPCSYILKTEEITKLLYTIGWIKTIKRFSDM